MTKPPEPPTLPRRLASVDAYRGFVMFLMMAEVLRLGKVAAAFPENALWKCLAYHQTHVEWVGCSLHDLIQPSFSFLVGVALPFSLASRAARGQSRGRMFLHAVWRAFVLIALGILLRSTGGPRTNYTFEDTLTQIGLGYVFLLPPRSGNRCVCSGPRWWSSSSGTGRRSRFIPCRGRGFEYRGVGVPRRLAATWPGVSPRTGTRTATSRGPSTPGS